MPQVQQWPCETWEKHVGLLRGEFPAGQTKFHDYKLVWNEQLISMYVDGFKYNEMIIGNNAGGTNAFHKPFFLLLNVAVGGEWSGFDVDDLQFPMKCS